jgi:hypothetical protein
MKQQIPKPENWQDFESLCKKVWGEIWQCPEIAKNGRSGQSQCGVDVYGIPAFDTSYYGIQCKGKDDYTNAKLTSSEVDNEIEKAKKFEPALKKLYFATTANKDVAIESYIRTRNVQNRELGLFEVHLFSWEDIVDLLEENKETYNWYVRKLDFKTRYNVKLTFQNNDLQIDVTPEFKQYNVSYIDKALLDQLNYNPDDALESTLKLVNPSMRSYTRKKLKEQAFKVDEDTEEERCDVQPVHFYSNMGLYHRSNKRFNLSCCTIRLKLTNTGSEVIENYKIYFSITNVINADTVDKRDHFLDMFKYTYDTSFNTSSGGTIRPKDNILVQNDSITFDEICIRPIVGESDITLQWKLVAKDYADQGELTIKVNAVIEEIWFPIFVSDPGNYEGKNIIKTKYKYA